MAQAVTRLRIPVSEMNRWPWLDAFLAHAASRAGVTVDGGEMVGSYRIYRFSELPAAELKPFVDYALLRGGERCLARVSGVDEITVQVGFVWIRPMRIRLPTIENPHPYFVEFRALWNLLAWDEGCTSWWATSGYIQFNFYQEHGDPGGPWAWDDDGFVYLTVPLDLSNPLRRESDPTRDCATCFYQCSPCRPSACSTTEQHATAATRSPSLTLRVIALGGAKVLSL